PLFLRRELRTLSTDPPKHQPVSTSQVKDDFPNAVSARYRMSCSVFRRNTRQHLENRGPMPGLAPKGSADLICDDLHIQRHRLSRSARSAERPAKLPGPLAESLKLGKPGWRPRSAFNRSSGDACVRLSLVICGLLLLQLTPHARHQ